MCELLAVAWERPEPFGRILPWARGLERVGIGGYGWGVAWLEHETGSVVLSDLLADGAPAEKALPEVHRRFGGKANFGFLSRDGALLVYGGNPSNAFWRFGLDGAEVAATQVHSDDLSLFDLLFDRAKRRRQVRDRVS